MTPKGADLEATDLIEVSTIESGSYVTRSITGQELIDAIPAPTGFVPETRTLTINGVAQDLSADRSWTISTGLTVGTTPISSGTIGRVLFQGTGNVLQQSSSLFWDSTNNRLGIGTSTPAQPLDVVGDIRATSSLLVGPGTNSAGFYSPTTNQLAGFTNSVERFRVFSNGNFVINTLTDAGFRLDVNGTARINTLTIGLGAGQVSTNTALGNVALNANTTGASNTAVGYFAMNNNRGGTNNTAVGLQSLLDNQNGNANTAIGRNALLNTSGSNNTAIGFQAGSVGVPNTTGENNIFIGYQATGVSASQSNRTWIGNSSTTSTWLAGNVLINTTTDAGYKLDVNGTARVNSTATTGLTITQGASGDGIVIQNGGYIQMASTRFRAFSSAFQFQDISYNTRVNLSMSGFSYFNSGGNYTFGSLTEVTSAIVNVDSTTKGFLPPRMTTTQKNAIASPATGLQIYDTTLNRPCFYDGTTWITL